MDTNTNTPDDQKELPSPPTAQPAGPGRPKRNVTPKEGRKLGEYWQKEIDGAKKRLAQFQKTGGAVVDRYNGKVSDKNKRNNNNTQSKTMLNMFHANISSLESFLYSQLPKIEVHRTFSDADDDVARVASTIIERLLNCDLQENGKEHETVFRSTLQDRLLPGLGCARVRYEYNPETDYENAPIDYVHWRNVLWSDGRTFAELTWVGFANHLTRQKVEKRFGKATADRLEYLKRAMSDSVANEGVNAKASGATNDADKTVKATSEIIEIYDRKSRKVYWYASDIKEVLDQQGDFLGVQGFFPCPPFLAANVTTTQYLPTADFKLAEDLYNNIDTLQTRIDHITESLRVVGLYDSSVGDELSTMFNMTENRLVPVQNFNAQLAEKGGINGVVQWFPVQEVARTLNELVQQRAINIQLLQEVTGMADVMRGEVRNQYEGVGQTQQKTTLGSARIQSIQTLFGQFISDLMQLKLDIISKHYDVETIAQKANLQFMPQADQGLIPQALQLIKNQNRRFRVKVQSDTMAAVDLAGMKAERMEYLTAMSNMLRNAAPLIEQEPNAKQFLLEMMKFGLAPLKGASVMEGTLDAAIKALTQQGPQDKPDEAQLRAQEQQMKMQEQQMKLQGEIAKIRAQNQARMAERAQDAQLDIQTMMAQLRADLTKANADSEGDAAEIEQKMIAKLAEIEAEMNANINQTMVAASTEIEKDTRQAQLNVEEMNAQANADLTTLAASKEIEAAFTPVETDNEQD